MPVSRRNSRKAGATNGSRPSTSLPPMPRPARPARGEDIYGGAYSENLLKPMYEVYAFPLLQRRHHKKEVNGIKLVDDEGFFRYVDPDTGRHHEWKVPYGVREALRKPLSRPQMVVRYPWYVTWRSPTTHRRLKKNFGALPAAVFFIATKAQYADPQACIVSRQGYDIPAKLRNKLPKPWKWCPCCMMPRKFYRVYPEESFYALIRTDRDEPRKERKVKLLRCKVCGVTNRNHIFRRSNQIFVVRKFKRGARRAKRRK